MYVLTFRPGWPRRKGSASPQGRLLQALYPRRELAPTCPEGRDRTKFPPVTTSAM